MRLRNKKTGEIKSIEEIIRDAFLYNELDSLKSIDANWEDYKPAKPYIKDKKVRKFVRDWAEHWKIDKVIIRFIDSNRIDLIGFPSPSSTKTGREIDIQRTVVRNEIIYGNRYTIDELCGEEEE